MSFAKRVFSTVGKLGIIVAIAIAFFIGLVGTVYWSLRSPEVKVPNIVGKDVMEGEAALDQEGLNMRRRASRYSPDAKPNTIIDQSPHPGEIIKVGQTVAVVISRATAKEGESPVSAPSAAEESFATENKNTNEASSSSKNENENKANSNNTNKRSRNTNNSNNANNSNNSNSNRNANNRNANNRNANDRNANDRNVNNRNANTDRNVNANRSPNTNSRNPNTNSNRTNSNSNTNRRAPVMTTPPFIPNSNRRTP